MEVHSSVGPSPCLCSPPSVRQPAACSGLGTSLHPSLPLLVLLAHQEPSPAGSPCHPPFSLPCFDSSPLPSVSSPSASLFLATLVSFLDLDLGMGLGLRIGLG